MERHVVGKAVTRGRRERYGLLLAAIVTVFAVQGIATPGVWEQVIVTLLLSSTLMLALWAADAKPKVTRPALVISAVVIVISVVEAIAGDVDGAAVRIADLLLV